MIFLFSATLNPKTLSVSILSLFVHNLFIYDTMEAPIVLDFTVLAFFSWYNVLDLN